MYIYIFTYIYILVLAGTRLRVIAHHSIGPGSSSEKSPLVNWYKMRWKITIFSG